MGRFQSKDTADSNWQIAMVVRHGDVGRSGKLLVPWGFKGPGKSTVWLTPMTATSGRQGFLAGTGGGEALAETP